MKTVPNLEKGQIQNQDNFLTQKQVWLNSYFFWTWNLLHRVIIDLG